MQRFALALQAAVLVCACSSGRQPAVLVEPPSQDGGAGPLGNGGASGGQDAGPPTGGGTSDGGMPDGGGTPDGGGQPDAGPSTDGGSTDGGSDTSITPPPPDPHKIGGLGAGLWPTAALTVYGSADGLLEAPLSASSDEKQNIWAVTERALYLLRPGEKRFRRFTAADGLHVGPGYTEGSDFTLVVGGGKGYGQGECFVGYYFRDTHDAPGQKPPVAHTDQDWAKSMGKMDQVVLRDDGTIEARRYDFRNTNDWHFYETRTIMSAVYDHFQHPGELYIGSNHGVNRILPGKWRLPRNSAEQSDPHSVEKEWYADHVHPRVCQGQPCTPDDRIAPAFGDFFGLALADDGRLWMGGMYSAGAIGWVDSLEEWYQSYRGHNPFIPAFGDPYPDNAPVFRPPREGDPVNIRAVAVDPKGIVWFASGEVDGWRGPTYGIAAWEGTGPRPEQGQFTYFDPMALGAAEFNVLELVALPDGRLVAGFPNTGLLVWKPGDAKGHRLTTNDGLPGNRIGRMYLDRMVDPPALYVPTDGGLAVFRAVR